MEQRLVNYNFRNEYLEKMNKTNCHLVYRDGRTIRRYIENWWLKEIHVVTNWSPIQLTTFIATGEFWYNCPVFREKECIDVP